jgi:ABC-type branched-subunit amino acid transport system substrate-binding protein
MAVIGHYSSEATQRALPVYAQAEMVLVNSSSTSNQLSSLEIGDRLCFFRTPPRDAVNAATLVRFLGDPRSFPTLPQLKKVAIIYAKNSIYGNSYRQAIEHELSTRKDSFQTIPPFGYVSEEDIRSSNYIESIDSEGVDIVIIIIDARIDPNFLANTGLLNELNLDRCILAGSATLYKQNFNRSIANPQAQIVSCLPWHWDSLVNGCNSERYHAKDFCALADRLWGEQKVTWRSATAFDSVLTIYRILQQFIHINDARSLLEYMDRQYKIENNHFEGVTGTFSFQPNGDRLNPPTEIVKLEWDLSLQKWRWKCISHP